MKWDTTDTAERGGLASSLLTRLQSPRCHRPNRIPYNPSRPAPYAAPVCLDDFFTDLPSRMKKRTRKAKIKKEESNDIVQCLLPSLMALKISAAQCKVDTSTESSGRRRGDVWISRSTQPSRSFEKNIIGLIEAKHRKCEIGDIEWRDAMAQGKAKAQSQSLTSYAVTNCTDSHRFYNAQTDDEIIIDGKVVTKLQPVDVLEKMLAQVTPDNSYVTHKSTPAIAPMSETKFRRALQRLADVYRSCGLKKGDERIDPTVSFVILKYIGEKEREHRTLDRVVKVWDEYGTDKGNYRADFDEARKDIFRGNYGDSYKDFKELVSFPNKLANEHYRLIYDELNQFHFHGCNFDVFGAIYEEFASQSKKKEFGEFYTRRHITGMIARLLLRNETTGRDLKICDPACGTGGFLTEAYKALVTNYTRSGKMNSRLQRKLESQTFWGFDNDEKSVARTKLNMFLVGDGHTHIYHIKDSLVEWDEENSWNRDTFDYVLANPPMGPYSGDAEISDFSFTNESRCDLLFAERIIAATKPGNEIGIVVPDGMLEAPSRENFRKKLLYHCDIQAVLSLTRFAFAPYTKEKTYALFLRKKQDDELGENQTFPIWHFIVDYDGFANSDKRFKTKWHDDLPELEEKFDGALKLATLYSDKLYFNAKRGEFERAVNHRESEDGLTGLKYGFVDIATVNDSNFHNLLSEFHLRPIETNPMTLAELDKRIKGLAGQIGALSSDFIKDTTTSGN